MSARATRTDPDLQAGATRPELVSEPLAPATGSFDAARMGRGEPGLPAGFRWRDRLHAIVDVLACWKESSREGGRASADLYLRRHYYKLRMGDGRVWTVYFIRQAARSGSPKQRWFLYTVETVTSSSAPED